jgi:catechol 2,3-dioxygenase-like lactoylglutathione lyase family enzyme
MTMRITRRDVPAAGALRRLRLTLGAAALALACATAGAQTIEPVRIGGVGRMVTDVDRSVAFYQMLGFTLDEGGIGAWHKDTVTAKLFAAPGVETRDATLVATSNVSMGRFVVRLTEVRGIRRQDLSDHTPWEPGATHFGLVVPDAQQTWDALRAKGLLRPRSWGGELIAPPGQTKGMLAYMTDPDGLDIELIDQRPNRPSGVSHVGLIILDADRARGFYETLLGGQLQAKEAPWLQGDFYDSAVGGHGNILRFFNLGFPEAAAPAARMNLELVEFQNRKKPAARYRITDRGLGYLALQVHGLDAVLAQARKAGARLVSTGIVKDRDGAREVLIRDPDTGAFLLLRE